MASYVDVPGDDDDRLESVPDAADGAASQSDSEHSVGDEPARMRLRMISGASRGVDEGDGVREERLRALGLAEDDAPAVVCVRQLVKVYDTPCALRCPRTGEQARDSHENEPRGGTGESSHATDGGRGGAVVAVDGVSWTVRSGEVLCLLGHNGAGKTTTIDVLTGLLAPTSGDAHVCGKSVVNELAEVQKVMVLALRCSGLACSPPALVTPSRNTHRVCVRSMTPCGRS